MPQDQSIPSQENAPTIEAIDEMIRETAREGARQLLQQALVAEIEKHLEQHSDVRTEDERQAVVRNGYAPERTIMMEMASTFDQLGGADKNLDYNLKEVVHVFV